MFKWFWTIFSQERFSLGAPERIDFIEGVMENYLGLQSLYEEQEYGSKIKDIETTVALNIAMKL